VTEVLWYVSSDSLGVDETIGRRLVQSFWNNLPEAHPLPATFAFLNRGVFLTLDDSPVLESLRALEAGGSRLLSCGTCLDFYGVKERLAVGEVGSMPLIQSLMVSSTKVITL
jgi:selenium metabolism protein YedF